MPTLADLARMRFRPAGAIGGSTVPAGTGGIKPAPGQTPPITAQANTGKVGADQVYAGGEQGFDFTGAANTGIVPPNAAGAKPWGGWLDGLMGGQHGAYQNMYQGGNLQNDGSFPRYEASTPMNTAGQGSPLTMNANGIAPPANTAQGMPGGLGGMQGGFGGLFGNLGGGNFLGGHQPGRPQRGTYGRPSNPNRAPMTNPNPAVGQDWASVLDSGNADALYNMYIKGGYSPEWIQQQINANTYDTAGNPIAGQGYDATIDALRAKRIAALQALQQRLPPTT